MCEAKGFKSHFKPRTSKVGTVMQSLVLGWRFLDLSRGLLKKKHMTGVKIDNESLSKIQKYEETYEQSPAQQIRHILNLSPATRHCYCLRYLRINLKDSSQYLSTTLTVQEALLPQHT